MQSFTTGITWNRVRILTYDPTRPDLVAFDPVT